MTKDDGTSFRGDLKSGFVWFGTARAVSQVADLGSLVAVLMFLSKGELGIATLAWSIAVVLEAFNGMGIGAALVRSDSVSPEQWDSSFWYTMGFAALLFAACSAAAPLIADLYNEPRLTWMIVVSASKLLLAGAALIPLQRLNRELRFQTLGELNVVATLASAGVKISLAAAGFGAWALVIGHTSFSLAIMVAAYATTSWWPRAIFRFSRIRDMALFGAKVATSRIIFHFYRNVDYLLVGGLIGKEALGVYRVAFDIAMTPATLVLQVINRAAFPVFARLHTRKVELAEAFTWTTRGLGFVLIPVAVLLFFAAPHIVWIVGDGKWSGAAPVIQLLCGAGVLRSLNQLYPSLFAATRPSLAIYESLASCAVLVGSFWFALSGTRAEHGVVAIGWAWLLSYPVLLLIAWALAQSVIPLSLRSLLGALRHPLAVGLATAIALYPTQYVPGVDDHPLVVVLAQAAITAAVVIAYARLGFKSGVGAVVRKMPTP